MKLSKLFALMKQHKRIVVAQGATAQWVGDGSVLYPVYNLPKLTERTMQTLLDLTGDAWDKFTFEEHEVLHVSEEDFEEGQTDLQPLDLYINWRGVEYFPLIGGGKIYYIKAKYLKPFADDTLLSYSARKDNTIAVNEGLLLSAIIAPVDMSNDTLLQEMLYKLYDLTKRMKTIEMKEQLDAMEKKRRKKNDT